MDPVSGDEVEVMWVKGSGGDLGTLGAEQLAALRVDRLRALRSVYRGEQHEDEMQSFLDYCGFGPPGAAPSIDTAMHGLLEPQHVDHLHPDAVIALAAAADGEALTKQCFGDEVGWVPWRRPGFELGLNIAEMARDQPSLKGVVLGGHGLTTWGETSEQCEATTLAIIRTAAEFLATHGRPDPLGPPRPGFEPLAPDERRRRAAALAPVIRGACSTDSPVVGHWSDDDLVLDFIGSEAAPRVVPLGTSCPDHFIRTKIRPLLLDLPHTESIEAQIERFNELHAEYRDEYRRYYQRYADEETPPMRGADPAIVLVPGVGMFSFGPDAPSARIAGEFYINAINVINGADRFPPTRRCPSGRSSGSSTGCWRR